MKGFTIILQSLNEGKEGMGWGLAKEETRRPPKPQSLDCCFSFSCKKFPENPDKENCPLLAGVGVRGWNWLLTRSGNFDGK